MVRKRKLQKQKVQKQFCIFCYKLIVDCDPKISTTQVSNVNASLLDKLRICDKFYSQLHKQPTFNKTKKYADSSSDSDHSEVEEENNEESNVVEKIAASWNHEKTGVCVDCYYAVNTCTQLFERVEKYQKRLRWQLDNLHKVMKYASKITLRVQDFKEHLRGDQDEENVKGFRRKIYETCKQKLATKTIDGIMGWCTDDKGPLKTTTANEAGADSLVLNDPSVILKSSSALNNNGKQTTESTTTKPSVSGASGGFQSPQVSLKNHSAAKHRVVEQKRISLRSRTLLNGKPIVVESADQVGNDDEPKKEFSELRESFARKSKSNNIPSFSDSDEEIQMNYPKLQELFNTLLPHKAQSDKQDEDPFVSKENSLNDNKVLTPSPKKKRKIAKKENADCISKPVVIICDKCGKKFSGTTLPKAKSQLLKHLAATRLHGCHVPWKHTCKICNNMYITKTTLQSHISKMHGPPQRQLKRQVRNTGRFCCAHCQRKFCLRSELIAHFLRVHKQQVQMTDVRQKKVVTTTEEVMAEEPVNSASSSSKMDSSNSSKGDEEDEAADVSLGDIGEHLEAIVVEHDEN